MKKCVRTLLMSFLSVIFLLPLSAQEKRDTTICVFRFVQDSDIFYVPWAQNGVELTRLIKCVNTYKQNIIDGEFPIYVDGYSISQNSEDENLAMAKIRSNRVKSEIILKTGVKEEHFLTRNHAMGGNFVTVCIAVPSEFVSHEITQESATDEFLAWIEEQEQAVSEGKKQKKQKQTTTQTENPYQFAVRFNLLRWVTLTPDIGVEWRPSRSFGVMLNASHTSWTLDEGNYRYALWEVAPELRYYMGAKKKTYIGAMYKTGAFNYKFSETGIQGHINGGGLTGGYMLQLSKSLVLDFGLGLGYLQVDKETYDNTTTSQSAELKNWWGPIDAKISLVWMIF